MTKEEAIQLIDPHRNDLLYPVEMPHQTLLRMIIDCVASVPREDLFCCANKNDDSI